MSWKRSECERGVALISVDVNRSSSVDKTVGAALLAGADLSGCALITSGMLSGVMVAKAARAGLIPDRTARRIIQRLEQEGILRLIREGKGIRPPIYLFPDLQKGLSNLARHL